MVEKEVVKNKLISLEQYIKDLEEYRDIDLVKYKQDKIIQRYLERTLHLAIESILDIGNHIISDERLGSPNNNADIIKIMAKHGIIKDNKDKYIKMAKFRNIIVHDYVDIDTEIVLDIVKNGISDLKDIFRWYKEYVS
jgi:uncharacterized protein YutE (UPF0331/DUF86 family)